jgi:hypothetical protein
MLNRSCLVALCLVSGCSGKPVPQALPAVSSDHVRNLVYALAADSMEGRQTGGRGIARAANLIAAEMRQIGLEPGGDSGFYQRVPMAQAANGQMMVLPGPEALDTVPAARRVPAWNLIGVIGGGRRRDQVVLVTAHYDHVGMRRIANSSDSVFNGADDNASGTAALLEIARLIRQGPAPGRTIVFIAFTGEEMGGVGTRRYIESPARPLAQTVADLNLEMIGRPDSLAGGFGRAWLTGYQRSTMGQQLKAGGIPIGPDPRPNQDFFRRSDNYAFALRGIPSHTLSSFNLHADYHQPGDEPNKLDYAHMSRVISAAAQAVRILADGPRPEWTAGGRPEPNR